MTEPGSEESSKRIGPATFAEWLPAGTDLGDLSQPAVDLLWQQYDQVIWLNTKNMFEDPSLKGARSPVTDALARDVLEAHLGNTWCVDNLDNTARGKKSKETTSYLYRLFATEGVVGVGASLPG